jgi:hypothetical protein
MRERGMEKIGKIGKIGKKGKKGKGGVLEKKKTTISISIERYRKEEK